jgi:hypothetical protein
MPDKIVGTDDGWRGQFRFVVQGFWPLVADFYR